MKRDLNLLRELLLVIEDADAVLPRQRVELASSVPKVQHHLRLLVEAGFVRGVGETSDGSISVRLTWQGYEFLELIRDGSIWQRVQSFVRHKGKGLNVAILQAVLAEQARESVKQIDRWRAGYRARRAVDVAETRPSRIPLPATPPAPIPPMEPISTPVVLTPPPAATQFQFDVWNGEGESLPVHLL